MRQAIVHAIQQHIFKGDEITRRRREIALACRHQCGERIFLIDRYQHVSQLIVRCMQRYRQGHRTRLTQPVHRRYHARRAHRHAPPRQTISVIVEHDIQRGDDIIEISQRLAHAHHHHVADIALALRRVAQGFIRHPKLTNNFRHRQIAVKALTPGRTKGAGQRAADLRRDAQSTAIVLGNEHRFHRIAGPGIDQPLDRAVGRTKFIAHLRRGNHGLLHEIFTQ